MVRVKIEDFGDPSSFVCARGRVWFRRHGLDWEDFKKNGMDSSVARATGDSLSMIERLEQTALRRIAAESENA